MRPLSWIIGLDPGERCVGALRWAAWLHARAGGSAHAFVGVFVVEPARLAFGSARERDDDAIVAGLRTFVDGLGLAEVMPDIEVVRSASAAQGLLEVAARAGSGLLVGRSARSHGWSLAALGSTARRVLRAMPGPVCVVPPDYEAPIGTPGPIALALEHDDTCVDATRMAVRIARDLGSAVIGVHATAPIDPMRLVPESSISYEPFPTTDRDYLRLERAARDRFTEWFRGHDLEPLPLTIEHGAPAKVLEEVGAREHASLIVCGSRRLGLTSRLFTTSVGTDLAAHATRPVTIVPPGSRVPE